MTCYNPLKGYYSRERTEKGKRKIVFNPKYGYLDLKVDVPCGQCIGCRLEYSKQWAIRCVNEAQMHEENCFITLTYSDENLPKNNSLRKEDFQKFIKRLRKYISPLKVRYYACGEYGENLNRPHYHALLFGICFRDRVWWSTRDEVRYYRSETLESLWPFGFCMLGEVTFESAAYVARYCLKKVKGDNKDRHYGKKEPEFSLMSRRPGIGRTWLEKYKDDVYPHDYMVIRNGVKQKPPRYYDEINTVDNNKEMCIVRGDRIKKSRRNPEDKTPERLKTRELCKIVQSEQLKRELH